MPSIKEIEKYLNKYVVLTKDIDIHERNVTEDILYDIKKISSVNYPQERVISGAITALDFIKGHYSRFYINSKDSSDSPRYFSIYFSTSVLSMASDFYNNLSAKDTFNHSLSYQGETLLMTFACNRFELIEPCYPKIIESILSGKMSCSLPWGGDGEGNVVPPQPQRLGILAIEMMASERKQTIDWASANIPIDPFYQRFCQEALYSTDEQELTYWLTKLCDNHLQWTSLFMENAVKQPSTGYEIYDNMLLLWPFEYQAVRNFRARHGLSTPEIDHPLLKTPMAIDHRPNFVFWQKQEWFDELVGKVTAVNPELNFVKEWVK